MTNLERQNSIQMGAMSQRIIILENQIDIMQVNMNETFNHNSANTKASVVNGSLSQYAQQLKVKD